MGMYIFTIYMPHTFTVALSLHMKSLKDSDINQLRDIFVQEDDFQSQAYLRISEAYESDVSDF